MLDPRVGIIPESRNLRGPVAEDPDIAQGELSLQYPLDLDGGCTVLSDALGFSFSTVVNEDVPLSD